MNRLKEIRKRIGASQKDLAHLLNVSEKTISRWERGERVPKSDKAQQLAEFFGVSVDYLLGDDNSLIDRFNAELIGYLTNEEKESFTSNPYVQQRLLDVAFERMMNTDGFSQDKITQEIDKTKHSEGHDKNKKSIHKIIKIDIPQNTLSDDELKELSPEERKKYISDYLDDLGNALSNLADFASTTAGLTADQISKINDTLIQALAKLNNIKNKNKD